MSLINEFQNQRDPRFQNTLNIPQVNAPNLQQEVAPIEPAPQPVDLNLETQQFPQVAPENEVYRNEDVDALINQRLATRMPTLIYGSTEDDDKRSDDFNEWMNSQIEASKVDAMVSPFMLPKPGSVGGFRANTTDPQNQVDTMNDDVWGNEFAPLEGRFGQMGNGVLGGLFYGLNSVFGTPGAAISDATTATGITGVSLWDAAGAAFQGKNPIDAFNSRFQRMYEKIYPGGEMYLGQLWRGRDFGALGAYMTGDGIDDYEKIYGKSPLASAFDKAFGTDDYQFRKDLQEFAQLSIMRNTYGAKVPVLGAPVPKFSGFEGEKGGEQYEKRYQELLAKLPDDKMNRFMARQVAAGVFDIFFDINPFNVLGNLSKGKQATTPVSAKILPPGAERKALPGYNPNFTMTDTIDVEAREVKRIDEYTRRVDVEVSPEGVSPKTPKGGLGGDTIDVQAVEVKEPTSLKPATTKIDVDAEVSPWDIDKPLRIEIPRSVEVDIDDAPFVLSGNAKLDKLLQTSLQEPRSNLPVLRLPEDIWTTEEGRTLVTPFEAPKIDVNELQQRVMSQLPPARVEEIEAPRVEVEAVQPEASIEPTWQVISQKGRVTVEDSGDMIRRTFTSGSAAQNETQAVDKLLSTDLIPAILDITPNSITYEKLNGVTFDKMPEMFPDALTLLGAKVKELHGAGVVHGDLHFGNVWLTDNGAIKFTDFENAGTVDTMKKFDNEVESEVSFIRDELEAMGADVSAFDKGYGYAAKVEEPVVETPPKRSFNITVKKAAQSGAVKKVDEARIEVVKPEAPEVKELEAQAVDLSSLNGSYDIREVPMLLSRAAAQPGAITFNGKKGDPKLTPRSTDQILRLGSLFPNPEDPSKPLIAPSVKIVEEFEAKYGVPHPYKEFARKRVPTKGTIASVNDTMKKGDRHNSIAHLAVKYGNNYGVFYQRILDPSGDAISDQILSAMEKGVASGEGIVIKTSAKQFAVMETPSKVKKSEKVKAPKKEKEPKQQKKIEAISKATDEAQLERAVKKATRKKSSEMTVSERAEEARASYQNEWTRVNDAREGTVIVYKNQDGTKYKRAYQTECVRCEIETEVYNRLRGTSIAPEILEVPDSKTLIISGIEGKTLEAMMDTKKGDKVSFLTSTAPHVAKTMAEMHSHGIVHNDLHNQNIMITPEGEVRFIDFEHAHIKDKTETNVERDKNFLLDEDDEEIMEGFNVRNWEEDRGLEISKFLGQVKNQDDYEKIKKAFDSEYNKSYKPPRYVDTDSIEDAITEKQNNINHITTDLTLREEIDTLASEIETSIIQEEKLKIALANVEQSRQEIESLVSTVLNKPPKGRDITPVEVYDYISAIIQRDNVISQDQLSRIYADTIDYRGEGLSNNPTPGLQFVWDSYSFEPSFGKKRDQMWLDSVYSRYKEGETNELADISDSIELFDSTGNGYFISPEKYIDKGLAFFAKDAVEAGKRGVDGWKRARVKKMDVTYRSPEQLENFKRAITEFPIPEHLQSAIRSGVVLSDTSTLKTKGGLALGVATPADKGYVVLSETGGYTTPVHEATHSLMFDLQGYKAEPDIDSLWAKADKIEPSMDAYGKTKAAEEITTTIEVYTRNPELLRVVSPLKYELANKFYENRQGAVDVTGGTNDKLSTSECTRCVAEYAAELKRVRDNPNELESVLSLNTLDKNQKLDLLMGVYFSTNLDPKTRIAKAPVELNYDLTDSNKVWDYLQSKGIAVSSMKRVFDFMKSDAPLNDKLYAAAFFVHGGKGKGITDLSASSRMMRVKESFNELNAIEFNARKAMEEVKANNEQLATDLVSKYEEIQQLTKQGRNKKKTNTIEDTRRSAKENIEKYSDENLSC